MPLHITAYLMLNRSDGTEVMVNNRYLKAYNPLLVIRNLIAELV